jgi:hypothetical protein
MLRFNKITAALGCAGLLAVWRRARGRRRLLQPPPTCGAAVSALAFSPDGRSSRLAEFVWTISIVGG